MIAKLATVAGLLVVAVACGGDPCQDYVDYMCQCHGDDSGFDCDELQRVYSDPDPSVEQQCQLDLSRQEDQDVADGESCSVE